MNMQQDRNFPASGSCSGMLHGYAERSKLRDVAKFFPKNLPTSGGCGFQQITHVEHE